MYVFGGTSMSRTFSVVFYISLESSDILWPCVAPAKKPARRSTKKPKGRNSFSIFWWST